MAFTPAYVFTLMLGVGVLSLVGCLALGIVCYRLLVDRGRLLLRLEQVMAQLPDLQIRGLQEGAYLSDVSLPLAPSAPHREPGEAMALSHLISSRAQPQLLMFLDSDCLYSRALARELRATPAQPDQLDIIVVIGGDPPGSPDFPLFSGTLLLDRDRQAAPIYGVAFTPAGYLVAPPRHTAGALLVGPAALLQAAQGGITQARFRSPLPVTPIPRGSDGHLPPLTTTDDTPDLRLTTATGAPWSLQDHQGQPLMLLFVDPDCPPCQETVRQIGACSGAGIAVISQGTPDDPLNELVASLPGLLLLMQQQRDAARAFRMLDTPAIYEVNPGGTISAGPIIGLQHITRYLADGICRHAPPGTSPV